MGWFPQPDIYGHGGTLPACILQFGQTFQTPEELTVIVAASFGAPSTRLSKLS